MSRVDEKTLLDGVATELEPVEVQAAPGFSATSLQGVTVDGDHLKVYSNGTVSVNGADAEPMDTQLKQTVNEMDDSLGRNTWDGSRYQQSEWKNLGVAVVTNAVFFGLTVAIFYFLRKRGNRLKFMFAPRCDQFLTTVDSHNRKVIDIHQRPHHEPCLFYNAFRSLSHRHRKHPLSPPSVPVGKPHRAHDGKRQSLIRNEHSSISNDLSPAAAASASASAEATPNPHAHVKRMRSESIDEGITESDEAVLVDMIGLDGIVALRFAKACLLWCAWSSIIGLILMYSYYKLGHLGTGANVITLANVSVKRNEKLFNLIPFAVWFFVLLLCMLMRREMKYFVHIRTLYFQGVFAKQKHMDERTKGRAQLYGMVNRSVFIENIPSTITTHSELVEEFRALFGASVVSGHLCPDVSSIRQIEVQIATLDDAIEATQHCCGRIWSTESENMLVQTRENLIHKEEDQKRKIVRACTMAVEEEKSGEDSISIDVDGLSDDTEHMDLNPKNPMRNPANAHYTEEPRRHFFVGHFPVEPAYEAKLINRLLSTNESEGGQCGFLAFYSSAAATMACQVLLQQRASPMRALPAPFPTDLIWDYLYKPVKDVQLRRTLSAIMIFCMISFWAVLASAVQAGANLDALSVYLPFLLDYRNTAWFIWLNGYLPVLALISVLAIAPNILGWWAYRFEYTKTHSSISREVFVRYSALLIASTYVTVLSGSIWTSLQEITDKPSELIQDFAAALPGVSTYFTSFVLAKIGLSLSNRLLRPIDLLQEGLLLYR